MVRLFGDNFYYVLVNQLTEQRFDAVALNLLSANEAALEAQIMAIALEHQRQQLYDDLIAGYRGDIFDIKGLANYLPADLAPYASDLDGLKEQLMSVEEFARQYHLEGIEKGPKCQGCFFNQGGQLEHCECGGCLHDSLSCDYCQASDDSQVITFQNGQTISKWFQADGQLIHQEIS